MMMMMNVFRYCEIAHVQYYSFFLYARIATLYNISVSFVAIPNNFLYHQIYACLKF